jgi:hypothetical protein
MSLRSKPLLQCRCFATMFSLDAGGSAIRPRRLVSSLNMSLRSKPLLQCRSCEPCSALMLAARRSGSSTPPRENRACRGPRASPPCVVLMSLRSKPLLQCRSCEPCSALMQAARRSGLAAFVSSLNMSLRSKPLLQCRSCEPCSALTLAARRSGSSTPPRENRACRGPRASPPCVVLNMSLRSKRFYSVDQTKPMLCPGGLARHQTAQARVPVPHFFDAFGQTHNYFTSRATWVMDSGVWQCPIVRILPRVR